MVASFRSVFMRRPKEGKGEKGACGWRIEKELYSKAVKRMERSSGPHTHKIRKAKKVEACFDYRLRHGWMRILIKEKKTRAMLWRCA